MEAQNTGEVEEGRGGCFQIIRLIFVFLKGTYLPRGVWFFGGLIEKGE